MSVSITEVVSDHWNEDYDCEQTVALTLTSDNLTLNTITIVYVLHIQSVNLLMLIIGEAKHCFLSSSRAELSFSRRKSFLCSHSIFLIHGRPE